MAINDEIEKSELETSTLPLTSKEESPPLVVDLPDGQKLVIGDIKAGTVIEVATWRGTGRPDSRTHRFMLGISHDEPEALVKPTQPSTPVAKESAEKVVVAPEPEVAPATVEEIVVAPAVVEEEVVTPEPEVASAIVEEVVEVSEPGLDPLIVEENVTEQKLDVVTEPTVAVPQAEKTAPFDRNELLFGTPRNLLATDVAYFAPATSSREIVPATKVAKKPFRKFPTATLKSKPLSYTLGVVLSLALIGAVASWQKISIVHPQSGLRTAMGDAQSTLIIVKQGTSYNVGDTVVGTVTGGKTNPVFGVIAAKGEGVYMLNADAGYQSVEEKNMKGKVLAIAPWWGKLASLLGL